MSDPRFRWGTRYSVVRQDPSIARPQKIGVSDSHGWCAYLRHGHLFMKIFTSVPGAKYPDLGSSVTVFINDQSLALDTMAPLTLLPAGKSVEYTEQRSLFRDVPDPTNDDKIDALIASRVEDARKAQNSRRRMRTEALWYLGERKVELRELLLPEPGPDEVLVAMEMCGVCGWDILAFDGRFARYHAYPFCAGHEGVGRVVKTGERVQAVTRGQRVALHELPLGTPGGALLARHALRSEQHVAVVLEGPLPVQFWVVEPVAC